MNDLLQAAAQAENNDNELEQKRQHGKRVRYGEIVQVCNDLSCTIIILSVS